MESINFTDRELDVMGVLWELGSATVPEVRERFPDDVPYTTVQTILRTLVAKGHVEIHEEGRFHRYVPLVQREQAGRSALLRLRDKIFLGSLEHLLTQAVSERDLDEAQLRRLRRLIDERLPEDER